ncbi:MAG TPA: beta-propeller fold lactonase family protein [Acidobacteriaceae bacterium]|jgi:6-phosphogluconolactonase (cycloisomerase 2 family)|nr:beta-propeller fold lactonase family protein [Acidobacteriaceae bacterium]
MKLKKIGRAALALAASAVIVLGMTSCTLSFTVGYLFVTGSQYNQIASYRIQNDNGALHSTSTVGSGGTDPIQVVVNATGSYLYVLNYGTGTDANPQHSTISLFSIGGSGAVTFQTSFSPQGFNSRNIAISGNFLYSLDEFAPGGTGPGGTQSFGAVSAFTIDPATGRLTTIQNAQQRDASNLPLTYFPVGTNPTWMSVTGAFAYIAEQGPVGSTNPNDPPQAIFIYNQSATNGQLTFTQNTPLPTGATQLTYVYATAQYIYALDAGPVGSTGFILPFTNSSGTLAAVSGAARANTGQNSNPVFPSRMIKETTHNFIWVSSEGVTTVNAQPASLLTAYTINTTGQLNSANNGGNLITVGPSPRCIVEDPSNQYVYTANFNDSTITGKKIDQVAGGLTSLPRGTPAPPGSPTWCTVTGSTF